jgi:hypothetical protein
MGKRTYQVIQNRRNEEYLEGRVMGVGGNTAYGGTRRSFDPPTQEEHDEAHLPLDSSDWEEYHKPPPADEPSWRGPVEFLAGVVGIVCLLAALLFPQVWQLVLVGAAVFAFLMISAAVRRGGLRGR